jgi:hypothetical protein
VTEEKGGHGHFFVCHVRRNEILNQVSQPLTKKLAWPSSCHVEIRRGKGTTRIRIRHRPGRALREKLDEHLDVLASPGPCGFFDCSHLAQTTQSLAGCSLICL